MTPRTRIASGSPFEATIGFSRALRVGDRVLVSGTGPVFPDGSCPDDAAAQARRCFAIIENALVEAGATVRDVVRSRMLLTDEPNASMLNAIVQASRDLLTTEAQRRRMRLELTRETEQVAADPTASDVDNIINLSVARA